MERTLRNQELRQALYIAAGGLCANCHRPISVEEMQADHVIPYVVHATTNVYGMQALCRTCNLQKGGRMELADKVARANQLCDQILHFAEALRKHQRETIEFTRGIANGMGGGDWPYMTSPGFLVEEIVPGGGKSYTAVMAASILVGSGLFDVAVWISPRITLIQQAKDDFSSTEVGMLRFAKKIPLFNPAGLIPCDLRDGKKERLLDQRIKVWVLPYQRLDSVKTFLSHLVAHRNVLLIFDEFQLLRDLPIGGAGDNVEGIDDIDGWFSFLDPLIRECQQKTNFGGIILSGGLYRNDNRRLPCISYRQGDPARGEDQKRAYPLSDIAYTLNEAQADRCITKIDFDFYSGEVQFRYNSFGPLTPEDPINLQPIQQISEEAYNAKLVHFLDQPEVWQSIIEDMLESLDYYNPPGSGYSARYMVTSRSIAAAETHTAFLEEKGRHPLLIHSKLTSAENKRLEDFRRGRGEWDGLVSVAMGYIGLSVKDLSHLAYLSHYRSAAWINQAIHRVTRTDTNPRAPRYEHQLARIFLPNDPRMREIASQIMQDQNPGVVALPPPPPPPKIDGRFTRPDFEGHGASLSSRQFNTNGQLCSEHDFIEAAVRNFPQLNSLPRKTVEDFKKYCEDYRG